MDIPFITRIYYWLFTKLPDIKTLDKSGIVNSDHPQKGNGWIKGWVLDCPSKDIIFVCRHANPSLTPPNNKVFVIDKFGKKIERTIIKIENPNIINPIDGLDICICKVDEPFPSSIRGYKLAEKINTYQKTVTINQFGKESHAYIMPQEKFGTIYGRNRDIFFVGGDSGTPWFVYENDEWRVASHTHKGGYGIGPWYGLPQVIKKLKEIVNYL